MRRFPSLHVRPRAEGKFAVPAPTVILLLTVKVFRMALLMLKGHTAGSCIVSRWWACDWPSEAAKPVLHMRMAQWCGSGNGDIEEGRHVTRVAALACSRMRREA